MFLCTQEELNYADLDLQKGPNARLGLGDNNHTVEYSQVAETVQWLIIIHNI